jgi:hypothetical protein
MIGVCVCVLCYVCMGVQYVCVCVFMSLWDFYFLMMMRMRRYPSISWYGVCVCVCVSVCTGGGRRAAMEGGLFCTLDGGGRGVGVLCLHGWE